MGLYVACRAERGIRWYQMESVNTRNSISILAVNGDPFSFRMFSPLFYSELYFSGICASQECIDEAFWCSRFCRVASNFHGCMFADLVSFSVPAVCTDDLRVFFVHYVTSFFRNLITRSSHLFQGFENNHFQQRRQEFLSFEYPALLIIVLKHDSLLAVSERLGQTSTFQHAIACSHNRSGSVVFFVAPTHAGRYQDRCRFYVSACLSCLDMQSHLPS